MTFYGITTIEFAGLVMAQGGRCAICREAPAGKELAIDHDHATGKVRGLLCANCNLALGLLHDDPKLMLSAVEYLRCNASHCPQ